MLFVGKAIWSVAVLRKEAFGQRGSVKNVCLEILQISQENTCARVSFLTLFSCEFCKISKNIISYEIPPLAASVRRCFVNKVFHSCWRATLLKLTSHSILLYLWSVDLSKSLSQLIMPMFIFSQYFFTIDFDRWKSMVFYPKLLIPWFINFKKELKHGCFSVNFAKFLRKVFS